MQALIAFGADIEAQKFGGITPLMTAAVRGNLRVVQVIDYIPISTEPFSCLTLLYQDTYAVAYQQYILEP